LIIICYGIENFTIISQVCINGLVSFGKQLKAVNFKSLNGMEVNVPFIAPNWFDFDTLHDNGSRVYYRSMTLGENKLVYDID